MDNKLKYILLFSCIVLLCEGRKLTCNRQNEEARLVAGCPPEKTCRTRNIFFNCLESATVKKTWKCVCKEGYYRNVLGDCISEAQCEQCSKDHEFFSCGSACDNECSKLGKTNRTNCDIINITCNKKCYCEDGYARDSQNNCVPIEKCNSNLERHSRDVSALACPTNQESRWVPQCPPQKTCRNRFIAVKCTEAAAKNITLQCVCKDGYYKNSIGECITEAECDQCSKPNEFFSCGPECDNECSLIGIESRTNCSIINIVCNKKCYCDDGYARDSNGSCIPIEKCAITCDRPNEESRLVADCPPERTCRTRNAFFKCSETAANHKTLKCVCKDGYYRNPLGECISNAECDQCSKDNEMFTCSTECDNECAKLGTWNRTNCPYINVQCNKRCYCEDGYARDYNNNCIPVGECPSIRCPQENEKLGCLSYGQEQPTCRNKGCGSLDPIASDSSPSEDSSEECCDLQCVCNDGLYRNAIGECISGEDCDKCTGDHEFFSCGKECDTKCSSLDSQNRTYCPSDTNEQCTQMCYCEDGYARDDDNNCIPVKKCNYQCNGPHEYFMRCKRQCPEDLCISLVVRYKCPPRPCVSGCICQDNYLRVNRTTDCIPSKQCPEYGGLYDQ